MALVGIRDHDIGNSSGPYSTRVGIGSKIPSQSWCIPSLLKYLDPGPEVSFPHLAQSKIELSSECDLTFKPNSSGASVHVAASCCSQ